MREHDSKTFELFQFGKAYVDFIWNHWMALIQLPAWNRGSGGQNDKNVNNVSVTTDMAFVTGI